MRTLVLCVVLGLLVGCTNMNVTSENYAQIKNGMTKEQVIAILGEPNHKGGAVVGRSSRSDTWMYSTGGLSSRFATISIQFQNDRVINKTYADSY